MAIINIKKRKIARELQEWIFLGIRTGARRSVAEYQEFKVSDSERAINAIKRAVDLPRRARHRINEFIRVYGQQQLVDCIALYGDVTVAEINAELTTLENYCNNLYNRKIGGESWAAIALDIESNVSLESEEWVFRLPDNYTDIWGE